MKAPSRREDDEFYVGYEGVMPPGIARRVRAAVSAIACAAAVAVATVLLASERLPASTFEYGVISEVAGTLRRIPYPVLDTADGRVWLSGPGKWGADALLAGVPDGPATLRGSRIRRGAHRMLEVHDARPGMQVTLTGEVVDSKCFLGVMNPGEGAVHRDCAARCLHGGMTPLLLVRDGSGREELVLLVSPDGAAIGRTLAKVAGRPIAISGRLVREGEGYVLYVEQ